MKSGTGIVVFEYNDSQLTLFGPRQMNRAVRRVVVGPTSMPPKQRVTMLLVSPTDPRRREKFNFVLDGYIAFVWHEVAKENL